MHMCVSNIIYWYTSTFMNRISFVVVNDRDKCFGSISHVYVFWFNWNGNIFEILYRVDFDGSAVELANPIWMFCNNFKKYIMQYMGKLRCESDKCCVLIQIE